MTLSILTAAWQRPAVLDLWMHAITDAIAASPMLTRVMIVGSEGDKLQKKVEAFKFDYCDYPNAPLSNKFNYGMEQAIERHDPDYVLVLGSDDIICRKYIRAFLPDMESGAELIGHTDAYVCDLMENRAIYWPGYTSAQRVGEPTGSGRFFSRELLSRMHDKPWKEGINGSLDFSTWNKIKMLKPKPVMAIRSLEKLKIMHCAMKSRQDKNKFGDYTSTGGRTVNKGQTMRMHFGERTYRRIMTFRWHD